MKKVVHRTYTLNEEEVRRAIIDYLANADIPFPKGELSFKCNQDGAVLEWSETLD